MGNLPEARADRVCAYEVQSGAKKNTLLVEQGILSLCKQLGHKLCAEL